MEIIAVKFERDMRQSSRTSKRPRLHPNAQHPRAMAPRTMVTRDR